MSIELSFVAIALMVAAIAGYIAKEFVRTLVRQSVEKLILSIQRRRGILSKVALRRYRRFILEYDIKHPLGFLRDTSVSVDHVYVPLRAYQDSADVDLAQALRGVERAVLLGSAGAGKSMFFRHWLVQWARQPARSSKVPILVDLHLYNDSLVGLIVDRISRRGIVVDEQAIVHSLQQGQVTLLLDGLDEVVGDRRDDLLKEIIHLTERFPRVQVVVSCRDAVYDGSLSRVFPKLIRIAGFDDEAIRRFLRLWFITRPIEVDSKAPRQDELRPLQGHAHVEQLLSELKSAPALLRLARVPLLLTMIASLQEHDPGLGPLLNSSRADFYELAVEHMLRRDREVGRFGGIAKYRSSHKKIVLRHIALEAQASGGRDGDSRSIPEPQLVGQVSEMLEKLHLEKSHARPMLDEIVSRSELLLKTDEHSMLYEFPHLTLQEYLAAIELGDDPERLLTLYREQPSRWRETTKLWCNGVNRDATRIVTELFAGTESDKILALECVAEAKQLDAATAHTIIDYFRGLHFVGSPDTYLILNALAAVASSHSAWGHQTFSFLATVAETTRSSQNRQAALYALSGTRLPKAIGCLKRMIDTGDIFQQSDAREALRRMGEQAISTLVSEGRAGSINAVEELAAMATPQAGIALSILAADNKNPASERAAWHVASLVAHPHVEEELREYCPDLALSPSEHWLWHPFAKRPPGPFDQLMYHIGFKIFARRHQVPGHLKSIDPRFAVPLFALGVHAYIYLGNNRSLLARADALGDKIGFEIEKESANESVADLLELIAYRFGIYATEAGELCDSIVALVPGITKAETRLFRLLPVRCRLLAVSRFILRISGPADPSTWKTLRAKARNPRTLELIYGSCLTATLLVVAGMIIDAGLYPTRLNRPGVSDYLGSIVLMIGAARLVWIAIQRIGRKSSTTPPKVASYLRDGSILIGVLFFGLPIIRQTFSDIQLFLAVAMVGMPLVVLALVTSRQRRAFSNPLRALMAVSRDV